MKRQNPYTSTNQTKKPGPLIAGLTGQKPTVCSEYSGVLVKANGRASECGLGSAKSLKHRIMLGGRLVKVHQSDNNAISVVVSGKLKKLLPAKQTASYVVYRAMADAEAFPDKLKCDDREELTLDCRERVASTLKLGSSNIDVVALAEECVDDIVEAIFKDVDEDVISRQMEAMFCGDDEEVKE